MTRLVVLLVVLTLLLLAAFSNPAAATDPAVASRPAMPLPPCEAASPVEVLDCLDAALNAADMHALDNLLARDFVADHTPEEGVQLDPSDREMFLKMMDFFFTNRNVEDFRFTFAFEGEPSETESGTWKLEGVRSALEVSGTTTVWDKDGAKSEATDQRHRVETADAFEIREVQAPVGLPGQKRHFEIVRWTTGE
jgi:hypothetical protein